MIDDPAATNGKVRGRPLPRTPGNSNKDLALVEGWINECLEHHDSCPKNIANTLPSRIIDVGGRVDCQEPFLLENQNHTAWYVALSHCWGGHVPLTTTTETLADRRACIPLSTLPPTFRDAVQITRRLGIQYLWIDSLCILQYSREDWEAEAAKMCNIYSISYLTIAARGAVNASIGCFIPRGPAPFLIPLEYQDNINGAKGNIHFHDPDFPVERIDDSPLDQRGWVFQERILPPRVLYYGKQQLYWECTTSTTRQDGKFMDVNQDSLRSTDFKQYFDLRAPPKTTFYGDGPPSHWKPQRLENAVRAGQWYTMVRLYSQRLLTFNSDKLPALAGVAQAFHDVSGMTYVAGLWTEDLPTGLLWWRQEAQEQESGQISDLLPSWTWARVDGVVGFWGHQGSILRAFDDPCEVERVSYKTSGKLENYGDVSEARLVLRHRYPLVQISSTGERSMWATLGVKMLDDVGEYVGFARLDFILDLGKAAGLSCLIIHANGIYPAGLILQAAGGSGTYVRIGFMWLEDKWLAARHGDREQFQEDRCRQIALV